MYIHLCNKRLRSLAHPLHFVDPFTGWVQGCREASHRPGSICFVRLTRSLTHVGHFSSSLPPSSHLTCHLFGRCRHRRLLVGVFGEEKHRRRRIIERRCHSLHCHSSRSSLEPFERHPATTYRIESLGGHPPRYRYSTELPPFPAET